MKFKISAFTHIGTKREINQDRILVNNTVKENGFYHLDMQDECFCFVADGIGGGVAGEIASGFVLENLLWQKDTLIGLNQEVVEQVLMKINTDLIEYARSNPKNFGTGTTLTGLIVNRDQNYIIINAGDSEIWILRNNLFFQVTEPQVMDETEQGSPLMSYFGGKASSLEICLNSSLREIQENDLFVISSDGLLNALSPKQLKAILSNNQSLKQKSEFILERTLASGANDNVSCILVEII